MSTIGMTPPNESIAMQRSYKFCLFTISTSIYLGTLRTWVRYWHDLILPF